MEGAEVGAGKKNRRVERKWGGEGVCGGEKEESLEKARDGQTGRLVMQSGCRMAVTRVRTRGRARMGSACVVFAGRFEAVSLR